MTSGLMVEQDNVTPELLYPLIGFTTMTPWPPLPAGTLLGTTAFSTVIVNWGLTASTVRVCGCVVMVCKVEGAVPVMVTEYATVVVSLLVVIVAEALAGGVTVVGLSVQTGGSVVTCVDVTWHVRSTVPLKLLDPTVMFEDDVPPGATASGDSGSAVRVKVWADADDGKVRKAANRHRAAMPTYPLGRMYLDFNDSDFNMSRFRFK